MYLIAHPTTLIKNGFLVAATGLINSNCMMTELAMTHRNTVLYSTPMPGTPAFSSNPKPRDGTNWIMEIMKA